MKSRFFLILGAKLDHEERCNRQNDAERQTDPDVLYQSGNDEHDKRDRRDRDGVRHLRGYVVEVVALTARGGHDGRIRDGGAVVAADRARKTRGHTDDEQLRARGEDGGNDWNENTERTPGCTRGKCQDTRNQEDDRGEE